MNNPRFTVLVRVNNPRSVDWAESSAAPTCGELLKFLLDYYKVEPTEQATQAALDHFNATHTLSQYFIQNPDQNQTGANVSSSVPVANTSMDNNKDDSKKSKKKSNK
jgi:hypothetical protein